jgi:hypothetical protein
MKTFFALALLGLIAPTILAAKDANAARDARLIAAAQNISVQRLDSLLPEMPLAKWLRIEAGEGAQFQWEVNDCGEQSGSRNDQSPVPTCVESDVYLKDGREIILFMANDAPASAKAPKWVVAFAQLVTPRETMNLHRLSDLPAALIKTHEPMNKPPEVAQ